MKPAQRILYYGFKAWALLFAFLPRRISIFSGRLLGRLAFCFLYQRKQITVNNIKRAFPEKKLKWCYRMSMEVFENYGANLMRFLRFALNRSSCRIKVEGMDNLKSPGGKIVLGCHLGNWEIAGMLLAAAGFEIYPIAKRIHTPAADRLINELRTTYGGQILSDHGGVRATLNRLKEDKVVYILFDQRIKKGLPVKFFNRPVWGTHIASLLHRRRGAEIIPCYSFTSGGRVEVIYEKPLKMVSGGDTTRAHFINTQRQFSRLEDRIRRNPAQWYWVHNMWKPRKKGWKAVFLDRDGTLNVDRGYVAEKEQLQFLPNVFASLRGLRKEGYLLVIVTNQSGIARGYYSRHDYMEFNRYFLDCLFREGVIVDRVYHCPHHPDAGCLCRKPRPGMLERAIDELQISINESFMVGDKNSDVLAGKKAGLKTIALGEGSFDESSPDLQLSDIAEAAQVILEEV